MDVVIGVRKRMNVGMRMCKRGIAVGMGMSETTSIGGDLRPL